MRSKIGWTEALGVVGVLLAFCGGAFLLLHGLLWAALHAGTVVRALSPDEWACAAIALGIGLLLPAMLSSGLSARTTKGD
jgi:hypothetical protein